MHGQGGGGGGGGGATSSSSTGLRVPNRAMAGRRAAPSTPVPSWKVFNNRLYDSMTRAPPPSARKLAASLWELNHDLPLPLCLSACLPASSPRNVLPRRDSPRGSPGSDFVLSPPPGSRHPRRVQARTSRYDHGATVQQHLHKLLNWTTSSMESGGAVERQRHMVPKLFASGGRKGEVEDGRGVSGTTMSQEVLKVFSQIRLLEEQHNSSMNLTSALHAELVAAHARVRELEAPHRSARREVESLTKRFAEEKAAWKVREKERVRSAVQAIREELDEERANRSRVESANRKLVKELAETQAEVTRAREELESERKARQLLEEVCQELAKETGADKAEAEEVKRQSQKVREELEEERRMLQLAEVWREERVQMKLGEAKLALEEKSAALDVMKDELESFLKLQHDSDPSHLVRDALVLHDVICAMSSSTSSFPIPSELHRLPQDSDSPSLQLEHDHKQGAHDMETRGEALYYPEGIPDAD